jgi:hypothetical protein
MTDDNIKTKRSHHNKHQDTTANKLALQPTMKFLSTNFAILFVSLAVSIVTGDDPNPCPEETATFEACVAANPSECDTCSAAMLSVDEENAESGGAPVDLSNIEGIICNALQAPVCAVANCGCLPCSAEFSASIQCSVDLYKLTDCDTTCQTAGGGDGDSSALGALSVTRMSFFLFGSLVLLA